MFRLGFKVDISLRLRTQINIYIKKRKRERKIENTNEELYLDWILDFFCIYVDDLMLNGPF